MQSRAIAGWRPRARPGDPTDKPAAYATDPDLTLKYSGQTVTMNYPYPTFLKDIQMAVEAALGISFNHVMLNRYEDGQVYIGKHSDHIDNKVSTDSFAINLLLTWTVAGDCQPKSRGGAHLHYDTQKGVQWPGSEVGPQEWQRFGHARRYSKELEGTFVLPIPKDRSNHPAARDPKGAPRH